jgi:hypothetical protein
MALFITACGSASFMIINRNTMFKYISIYGLFGLNRIIGFICMVGSERLVVCITRNSIIFAALPTLIVGSAPTMRPFCCLLGVSFFNHNRLEEMPEYCVL